MNIKITHRPCKVGVFMCTRLFQDTLNVGAAASVCLLLEMVSFLPSSGKENFPPDAASPSTLEHFVNAS